MSAQVPPDCPLRPRELEALVLVAGGLSPKEAGPQMGVGYSTVRTHLCVAYRKLNVTTIEAATALAWRRGWVGWKQPVEPPLAESHPWLHTYLQEFDGFLRSGSPDARERMRLALLGAQSSVRKAA